MTYTAEELGAIWAVAHAVRSGIDIECVRVSGAGAPCPYSYYGAARYVLTYSSCLRQPVLRAVSGASATRRSYRLAARDAAAVGLPVIYQVAGRMAPRTALHLQRGLYANES